MSAVMEQLDEIKRAMEQEQTRIMAHMEHSTSVILDQSQRNPTSPTGMSAFITLIHYEYPKDIGINVTRILSPPQKLSLLGIFFKILE